MEYGDEHQHQRLESLPLTRHGTNPDRSANPPRLPVELLQEIFRYFEFNHERTEDHDCVGEAFILEECDGAILTALKKRTLHNLRLVCWQFETLASQILFKSIKISYLRSDLLNFIRVTASPTLRIHVRLVCWEESAAAAILDDRPFNLSLRDSLIKSPQALAWWNLCWNPGLTRRRFDSLSVLCDARDEMREGIVFLIAELISRLPNLVSIASLPAVCRVRSPEYRYQTLFPDLFVDGLTYFAQIEPYFDLCSLRSRIVTIDQDDLSDGFFQFLLPALERARPKLQSLKFHDEVCFINQRPAELDWMFSSSFDRFSSIDIRPYAFANITTLDLKLPLNEVNNRDDSKIIDRMGQTLIRCLTSAKHLKVLTLDAWKKWEDTPDTERQFLMARDDPPRAPQWRQALHLLNPQGEPSLPTVYFFDFLVWGAGGTPCHNPPPHHWPNLSVLRLKSVQYNQLSLLRFLNTHSATLHTVDLTACRVEFRTIKEMARLPTLRLTHLSLASRPGHLYVAHARSNRTFPRIPTRHYEYIPAPNLLAYVNDKTRAEADKWADLGVCGGVPVPYHTRYNFTVGTDPAVGDVVRRGLRVVTRPSDIADYGEDVEIIGPVLTRELWEIASEQGVVCDFRHKSDEANASFTDVVEEKVEFATCAMGAVAQSGDKRKSEGAGDDDQLGRRVRAGLMGGEEGEQRRGLVSEEEEEKEDDVEMDLWMAWESLMYFLPGHDVPSILREVTRPTRGV